MYIHNQAKLPAETHLMLTMLNKAIPEPLRPRSYNVDYDLRTEQNNYGHA